MPTIGSQIGTCDPGPLHTRMRLPGQTAELRDEVFGCNPLQRVDWIEDFIGAAANLTNYLKIKDVSAAGTPTQALIADKHQYGVAHDATDEAQVIGLDFGDQQCFAANARPVWMARVKIDVLPTTSAQRMVFGLGSAYNGTFDSVGRLVWFRLEGNGTLLLESDDNTTDNDDQAAVGITALTAGAWYTLAIDLQGNPGYARYFVAPDQGLFKKVGELSCPLMDATTLQPMQYSQKDSGALLAGFTVDYVRVRCDRVG